MAGYLAQSYPGDYYSQDLAKSGDFIGYFDNQRQKQESLQNQQLNRQMALEDMFRQQQKFPLEQALTQSILDQRKAQLPGIEATSSRQVREEKFDASIPEDVKRTRILTQIAKETSAADLAHEKTQIEQLLLNPNLDPKTRAGLEFARNQFTDIFRLQQTLGNKEGIERYKVDNRPPPRASTGGASKPPADPKNHAALLTKLRALALSATSPEEKAMYEQQAQAVMSDMAQIAAAAAQAKMVGKPDLAAMGVPTVQAPGTAPSAKPSAPVAASAPMYATNPKTKERIVSTDGGKTWSPVK
jgi:hypothetical protein